MNNIIKTISLTLLSVFTSVLSTMSYAYTTVTQTSITRTELSADTNRLTNLVIFIRFADDAEITHPFADIDSMFNGKAEGVLSVYNYYKVSTYGKILFNTVYADQVQNGQIHSYVDNHPRGYFEPYSIFNPIGYQGELPFMGISMREAQLLARAIHYVDSLHLVDNDIVLDGDGDGFIDNLSFIVKGGTGAWASILWPHMEFFPHDSIDHPVQINGVRPNTFNFEFEGASTSLFSPHVFRHEMGHSLGLPDLYHYINYSEVSPAGTWDMMCNNYSSNQTNVMYKHKYLHVVDEPIQITEDGDYTLLSNASSSTQNCYYIKSSIDSTQWYVFEYRNKNDLFDEGIPGTGMIIARWNDTIPLNYDGMFANAFFDFHNYAHQYWIFRPNSHNDTEDGYIDNAYFSTVNGRTSFGPNTNPYPYLTNGTPEQSFEITDIQEHDNHLTFHVHFFSSNVAEQIANNVNVYPNPAKESINIQGKEIREIEIFNLMGQLLRVEKCPLVNTHTLSLSGLPAGMLMLRLTQNNGSVSTIKIVKQ